jgi:heme exporter protein A
VLSVSALECVRGERRLFSDLNFDLPARTLLEVRGANGSGKTSLLRLLCGLLAPAMGSIAWDQTDIRGAREAYNAQLVYIGHLNAVKDELSALENLCYSAHIAGYPAASEDVDVALRRFGLENCERLPCKALSQGQRRRVALARLVLSSRRALWLLDEPFTALDTNALSITRSLIESHLSEGGMVVLTTHQDVPIRAPLTQRIEL